MSNIDKAPVLVFVQLTGGNDFMNTIVPYGNNAYYDSRPSVQITQEDVLPINGHLGFNPNLAPLKEMYDEGNVAIIQGTGYPDGSRSHFRSMDIWHTCDTDKIVTEGWLGKVVKDLDPVKENPLTAVSFGQGLPRALASPGVPVTSVNNLDNYGIMSGINVQEQRDKALELFKKMYGPAIGAGPVKEYLAQTGTDVLKGADLLKPVPGMYSSDVEYADNSIARSLKDVARVHLSNMGTRIFYTQHGNYDTHANENVTHPKLLSDLSAAIMDFFQDLKNHCASDNVVMTVFTEFGRRIKDNGGGTDHGAGGGAFVIGEQVEGGLYAEYPSLKPDHQDNGDMHFTYDFRGLYSTLIEKQIGLEASQIVGGTFEQLPIFGD